MPIAILPAANEDTLPFRVRYRAEANGQVVCDSLHTRAGWTRSYLLQWDGRAVGFGSIAIAGPWQDRPTVFEFYLLPEARVHAFACFEALVAASGARYLEVQTSDVLLAVMLHTYGTELASEKIVFRDEVNTALVVPGAVLQRVTPEAEDARAFAERAGQSEWSLELDGRVVGNGAILFHYNHPYCDLAMEIVADHRRRGLGAYFVQELKRRAYALGGIPAARCSPDNIASRRTLQNAGFVPYAHMIVGKLSLV